MVAFNDYRERVLKGAKTLNEVTLNKAEKTFKNYLNNTITSNYYQATDIDEPCITVKTKSILIAINDLANNDKTGFDEKDIYVEKDSNIDVGCYVRYDNNDWLIVYQEHHPYPSKKHYVMRKCNNYITIKYKGEKYKIPILVENLTMYSDGIADNIYLSYMDSKKQIWYGTSPITRSIYENYRILLTHRTAFRVTHINDFEYKGLIKSLVLQTALKENDNFEELLADNDSRYAGGKYKEIEPKKRSEYDKIKGENKIIFGEELEYTIRKSNKYKNIEWALDNDEVLLIKSFSDENAIIVATTDFKKIGKKTNLIVKEFGTNNIIDKLEIVLRR